MPEAVISKQKGVSSAERLKAGIGKYVGPFASLLGLVVLVVVFAIATGGQSVSKMNLENILNQGLIVALVATGATFIYTSGSFDISLGAVLAMSAFYGATAYNATGSVAVMLLVCVAVAVGLLAVSSLLSVVLRIPVFIVTVAALSILQAWLEIALKGVNLKVPYADMMALEAGPFKYIVFLAYFAVAFVVFNYTKIGHGLKYVGGNPVCATQTALNYKKYMIIGFLIAGVGLGLGATLQISRTGVISTNTATSIGLDVMIAIVLGGMPTSGGARSNIFAGVIGAFTVTVLNNGLLLMSVDTSYIQAIRGVLFLVIVGVTLRRSNLLPR